MLNCIILDDYQQVAFSFGAWEALRGKVNVRSVSEVIREKNELVSALNDADIIVIMRERTKFDATLLSQLPKLKLLVTTGMRNAAIDFEYLKNTHVIVSGTRNFSEPPVELTWALIHALSRYVVDEVNAVRNNQWQQFVGSDLFGKQLGLLGFGKTGIQVARVAKAFGMNVVAWSQNLTQDSVSAEGVTLATSKDDLLKNSDIISIHLVLSERTTNLIASREILLMKKSALLINTSRAGIVNQTDLLRHLKNNTIKAAASDVFEEEPLPANHPFRQLKNFIPTPHIGYVTERNYEAYYSDAVENILSYLNKNPVRKIN